MALCVLTGAGFSRNWGGWLADEAFEYLLGCPSVDDDLKLLLWAHKRSDGFEGALGDLQESYIRTRGTLALERLQRLQDAIRLMFNEMDSAFESVSFEFQHDHDYWVKTFLARFDAIFTLNQDQLLERHYLGIGANHTSRVWLGSELPGVQKVPTGSRITAGAALIPGDNGRVNEGVAELSGEDQCCGKRF